jgi:hypothetical protein
LILVQTSDLNIKKSSIPRNIIRVVNDPENESFTTRKGIVKYTTKQLRVKHAEKEGKRGSNYCQNQSP